jgi:hypothetical protein
LKSHHRRSLVRSPPLQTKAPHGSFYWWSHLELFPSSIWEAELDGSGVIESPDAINLEMNTISKPHPHCGEPPKLALRRTDYFGLGERVFGLKGRRGAASFIRAESLIASDKFDHGPDRGSGEGTCRGRLKILLPRTGTRTMSDKSSAEGNGTEPNNSVIAGISAGAAALYRLRADLCSASDQAAIDLDKAASGLGDDEPSEGAAERARMQAEVARDIASFLGEETKA